MQIIANPKSSQFSLLIFHIIIYLYPLLSNRYIRYFSFSFSVKHSFGYLLCVKNAV